MVQKKFLLGLIIFILVVPMSLVGCNVKNPSIKTQATQPNPTIPVLLSIKSDIGTSESAALQSISEFTWDTNQGKTSWLDKPLYTRSTSSKDASRLVWDGGKNLLISSPTTAAIKDASSDFEIQELKPVLKESGAVIQNLSALGEIMIAYYKPVAVAAKKPASGITQTGNVVVEIRKGSDIQKTILTPPKISGVGPYPLLMYGNPDSYTIVAAFNHPAKKGLATGSLVIGSVNGKDISWQEVTGTTGSLVAGAGCDIARIRDQVYLSDTDGSIKVINLGAEKLELTDYQPANQLTSTVRDKSSSSALQPHLGAFQDMLLLAVNGSEDKWIWSLKNDQCIGSMQINNKENKLYVFKDSKTSEEKALSGQVLSVQLPDDNFGKWK